MAGTKQTVPRAALRAVTTAFKVTPVRVRIVGAVDASYVIKGWNRGPTWAATSNQVLWQEFWGHYKSRAPNTTELHKVKSHATEQQLRDGQIGTWQYIVNSMADVAAESAAAQAALPADVVSQVADIDDKCYRVARRLTRIAFDEVEESRAAGRVAKQGAREAAAVKLQEAKASTSHRLEGSAFFFRCLACFRGCTKSQRTAFFATPCFTDMPEGLHESHTLVLHRGVKWCTRCGAWGVRRFLGLAAPCKGSPAPAGRAFLTRLEAGKPPTGMAEWPMPEG